MHMKNNILNISDISVEYRIFDGVVKAVNDLNLRIGRKQVVGLVGESGAGKTTTALAILRLIQSPPGIITSGKILFEDENILTMKKKRLQTIRGNRISMIFQDPMSSLNPLYTVGDQIGKVIKEHNPMGRIEIERRIDEMLDMIGIPSIRKNNYPYEFSGGMKQRICIAMSIACNPSLLLADEPTTALDVTIQAQILELMKGLKKKYETSILFISHDLGVIADIADYVAVMYAGSIVEEGEIETIFTKAKHPYTIELFNCLPKLNKPVRRLNTIDGEMVNPMDLPVGCSFYNRCSYRKDECAIGKIKMESIGKNHSVKCLRAFD